MTETLTPEEIGPPTVYCLSCDFPKKPWGRSVSPHEGPQCSYDCPGYREDPQPSDLFPGERRSDFGYPKPEEG